MNHSSETVLLKFDEPQRSCLLALYRIISDFDSRLDSSVKYGMPCFSLGKRPFCYLWKEKDSGWPYILFVDGLSLKHPRLEQGSRAKMKIFKVDPRKDLPMEEIREVLSDAVEVRLAG